MSSDWKIRSMYDDSLGSFVMMFFSVLIFVYVLGRCCVDEKDYSHLPSPPVTCTRITKSAAVDASTSAIESYERLSRR
ncbi:hypothetical protein HanRHA438_Chr09g0377641 [Helianthus annuus]|nr:hypothetical protein HanRHA438_Chr09g0377641 [Helianthus annuus]